MTATRKMWETAKEAISGCYPYPIALLAIIFTGYAIGLATICFLVRVFASSIGSGKLPFLPLPLFPPLLVGDITGPELKAYNGSDPKKPLLVAIKGQIYDVSQERKLYGPGGPYALFAGNDASRALAKMSFDEKDLTGNISGLGPSELEALQDWEHKFMTKYAKVGTIKKTSLVTDESSTIESAEAASRDGQSETAAAVGVAKITSGGEVYKE